MISAKSCRYIKLGEGGAWQAECFKDGVLRLGFASGRPDMDALCRAGDWDGVWNIWRESGKSEGTATRFTNEAKAFYNDPGNTLWISFVDQRMIWGFAQPGTVPKRIDDDSSTRPIVDGWRDTDLRGYLLTKSKLPGAIAALSAYRGTSCRVPDWERLVRRLNGQSSHLVEAAISAHEQLSAALLPLIRQLGPKDFELLVDLIFSASGWRRIGAVGGAQKTLDFELELPTTRQRAMVQVKSRTDRATVLKYIEAYDERVFTTLFYAYHSGDVGDSASLSDSLRLIGPNEIAEMSVSAGLFSWLIDKAS